MLLILNLPLINLWVKLRKIPYWSLFPGSKAVVAAHAAELGDRIAGPGTLHFPLDEPVPAELVATIVRERLAENATKRKAK